MTKEVKMYKIRNSQGLFSTGGITPTFTKIGKMWSNIGNVKNHLNTGVDIAVYDDCELVEIIIDYQSVEENCLQIMYENRIVKSSLSSSNHETPEMIVMLQRFVKSGKCFSSDFKDFIQQKKSRSVEYYVPDYMIEKFELFHNKGIEGCSDTQLAAIILTATQIQQKLYSL